jgi:integrase
MLVRRWHKTRKQYVWDIRIYNEFGKKQLFSTGHTSKTEAKRFENKLKNEMAERRMFPEKILKEISFIDFITIYKRDHVAGLKSVDDYKSILKKLEAQFGYLMMHQLQRHHIDQYKTARYSQVSVYMANREITILKGLCTKAIEWNYLKYHPVRGIKLKREDPRIRFLNNEELDSLLAAINKKALHLRSQIIITVNTGVRKEELLSIKVNDIDLENNLLTIKGKGGKKRLIPINKDARDEFMKLINTKNKYIFSNRNGKRIKDFKRAFQTAVKDAGLSDVRIHDIRRTFGTRCALNGVTPKTLQTWMGHEDVKTTLRHYVNIPEDYEREAIERINRVAMDSGKDTSEN